MKTSHKTALAALALITAAGVQQVMAATQGSLGNSSTATAVITVVIPETLRISNMNDLNLGAWPGSGDLSANDDICIYDNSSNGKYSVTITDDSALSPTGFSAQNATGNAQIPFTVKWNDQTGVTGNKNVTYNSSMNATGANNRSTDCSIGGKTANLYVSFLAANLQAAKGGAYASTLTVMVEP